MACIFTVTQTHEHEAHTPALREATDTHKSAVLCKQAVVQDEKPFDAHFGSKAAVQAADTLSGRVTNFFSQTQSSGSGSELTLQSAINAVQQALQVSPAQHLAGLVL